MPLHLLKLAVGCDRVADLEARIEQRLETCQAANQPVEHTHKTRMVPKRASELLDGGSHFWVIKGKIAARQKLIGIRPFTDDDGIGRCFLVLEPHVHAVVPRPCRPFQGWRYLSEETRPADLDAIRGASELPERLAFELRELCLL